MVLETLEVQICSSLGVFPEGPKTFGLAGTRSRAASIRPLDQCGTSILVPSAQVSLFLNVLVLTSKLPRRLANGLRMTFSYRHDIRMTRSNRGLQGPETFASKAATPAYACYASIELDWNDQGELKSPQKKRHKVYTRANADHSVRCDSGHDAAPARRSLLPGPAVNGHGITEEEASAPHQRFNHVLCVVRCVRMILVFHPARLGFQTLTCDASPLTARNLGTVF